MTVATAPRVELQGLSKRFGNVLAVDRVSLSIEAGTVHALVGANGAGKSTLGQVIGGLAPPGQTVQIEVDGRAGQVTRQAERNARKDGIALIAQELALVPVPHT